MDNASLISRIYTPMYFSPEQTIMGAEVALYDTPLPPQLILLLNSLSCSSSRLRPPIVLVLVLLFCFHSNVRCRLGLRQTCGLSEFLSSTA
eukprot:702693-Hanusia_phi.AAC.1